MFFDPRAMVLMIILVAVSGWVARGLMSSFFKLRREDGASASLTNIEERLKRIEEATSGLIMDVTAMREKERFFRHPEYSRNSAGQPLGRKKPTLESLSESPRQADFCVVGQDQDCIAAKPWLHFCHTIDVDEKTPVHANESECCKLFLELAEVAANEVARGAHVKSYIVRFRFDPVNIVSAHESNSVAVTNENSVRSLLAFLIVRKYALKNGYETRFIMRGVRCASSDSFDCTVDSFVKSL